MSSQKVDRRERELVNHLDDAGFAMMRAPASGSATPANCQTSLQATVRTDTSYRRMISTRPMAETTT